MKRFGGPSISIKQNTDPSFKDYLKNIISIRDFPKVLKNIHKEGVFHNHIKPDNIMRVSKDSYEIAFVDFGFLNGLRIQRKIGNNRMFFSGVPCWQESRQKQKWYFWIRSFDAHDNKRVQWIFFQKTREIWNDGSKTKNDYAVYIRDYAEKITDKFREYFTDQCGEDNSKKFINALKETLFEAEKRITLEGFLTECEGASKSCEEYKTRLSDKKSLDSQAIVEEKEDEKPENSEKPIFK
jgi:hypothetical protein